MRIVYIDVDSLRPDHMGCYGYHRNTTPNIDALAAQGTRFNYAYCEASPCVPSRASFMSGRFAMNHGALTHWGPGGRYFHPEGEVYSERYPFFTRYLREAGYKTVTISSFGDRHLAWWFFAGWSEIHSHTLKRGNEDANEVNDHVLPWIEAHGMEDNYFLHVQYWDPHGFYTYPDEYMEQFRDTPVPTFPTSEDIATHRRMSHPRSASFFLWPGQVVPRKMPREIRDINDFRQLIDGYDGGIFFMDKHVGQIIEAYRKLGIEDEVCFIITADHGESFGEQGIYMEHGMATESVHHIPLIIRLPRGTKQPATYDGFVYNVDVIATVVHLAGLKIPSGWDGRSLLPVLTGGTIPDRDYVVLEHGLYAAQRAVRDKRWYFIRTYDPGFYNFDSVVLYDLETDPHQRVNVAAEYPSIVQDFEHRLSTWIDENRKRHGFIMDPMQEIIQTGPYRYLEPMEWIARLREAGWNEQADRLEARIRRDPYR